MKPTTLLHSLHTAACEEEARGLILHHAAACVEPAWVILQSFTNIFFTRWDGVMADFASVFHGRIFSEQAEVRWVREGSQWTIWALSDTEGPAGDHHYADRRYYLWGIYGEGGVCSEDRIPGVPSYPLSSPPNKHDRAFVMVREYSPLPPSEFATASDLEDFLNQPRIAAHRFLSLQAGQDPETGQSEDV